jgi:hypothetical protein
MSPLVMLKLAVNLPPVTCATCGVGATLVVNIFMTLQKKITLC